METSLPAVDSKRYAKCVEVSKRVRWSIDDDVIKGRAFDFTKKFLPDGLSKVAMLSSLSAADQRCCRRSRAAPTPTCSASSSASSVRRSWK